MKLFHSLFPIPYSLFPIPYSLFPIPYSLFPTPYSLFPVPYSLFPIPYSLFPTPYSLPYSHFRMISVALIPPNPNEFDSAMSNECAIALLGT